MHRKAITIIATVMVVFVLGTVWAEAQAIGSSYARRPTGIIISNAGINLDTISATVNVEVNTSTASYITSTVGSYTAGYTYYYGPFQFGMLGSQARSWSGWGYATVLNPDMNAVEWGHSTGTIDGTTVPLVAGSPGSFRGSFTHTFPTYGQFDVQALTTSFWLFTDVPGNPYLSQVTNGEPVLIPPGAPFTTYATYWGATYSWAAPTQTASYAPITASYAIGLYDTVRLQLDPAIPTLSIVGLFMLAVVLAGIGFAVLLWRR